MSRFRVVCGAALLVASAAGPGCAAAAGPPETAAATPAEAGPTLSVLTLNIWHDQEDWPARLDGILAGIRALAPDVIALQEVLQHEDLANQAETIAGALGYSVYFTSLDPPDSTRRYGNAILTRHPVLNEEWHALEPADDYRSVAHVRIEVDDTPVDLYDTHLHHTLEGEEIRRTQLRDLLDFVDATRGDGPVVLMGDFNAEVDWPEMAPVRERYRDALAELEPELADTVTTLNPEHGHEPRRIDHVFFGPGAAGALRPVSADVVLAEPSEAGIWPSDHFGVAATFAVTPPPDGARVDAERLSLAFDPPTGGLRLEVRDEAGAVVHRLEGPVRGWTAFPGGASPPNRRMGRGTGAVAGRLSPRPRSRLPRRCPP